MRIRLQLFLWVPICILLLKDGDSNKFDWDQVVPYLDALCQVEGECNETLKEKESLNIRQAENPCCKGCFCDACPDHPITKYAGLTECFNTIDDARIIKMYHVVAKAPANGCVSNRPSSSGQKPSCGPDVVAAPWGNYYPVYAFDKKVNFKNIQCALCHGATDILRWNVYPFFWGKNTQLLHAMRSYYNDFKSDDFLLEFYPPTRESWQYEHICFDSVIVKCGFEKRDIFHIPNHVNLTRAEVIQACEQGEVSPYRYSDDTVYKNVFCTICDGRTSSIDGSVICGIEKDSDEAIKGARGTFASLIDYTYIDSKLEVKKRTKSVKLACLPTDANKTSETRLCREVLCPALQIRNDGGACFYPMDKILVSKLEISLNLTTAERIDTSNLQNMSKEEIDEVFKRTMPWPKNWELVLVMLRIDTNSSEFVVVVGYRNFDFLDMKKFRRLLEVALSRPWPVELGRTYTFNQSFDVHGIPRKADGIRKNVLYGKPKWTELADTNEMIANLSSPTWHVLLSNSRSFYYDPPGSPLEITKIFLCDQIELYEDEFIGILNAYPAFIKHSRKIVYPRQYYMYYGENGSQIINVCLEDSDYDLMPDNNAAPRLKMMFNPLILLFMLLFVMMFMMHYLY